MNNCETCNIKNFVHADLYCHDCQDKPQPRKIKGRAYLHLKNKFEPVLSMDVEVLEGFEKLGSAHELMKRFEIEFISEEVI